MQTYSTKTRGVAHIPAIWIRTAQSIGSWGYTGDLQRGPCTTASAQEKEEEKGEVGYADNAMFRACLTSRGGGPQWECRHHDTQTSQAQYRDQEARHLQSSSELDRTKLVGAPPPRARNIGHRARAPSLLMRNENPRPPP